MQKKALLIIDAQNEMFAEAYPVYKSEELLGNLRSLIDKARADGAPVVFVQHNDQALVAGTHDWQIHHAIQPEEGDAVVQKKKPDAFQETGLQDVLNEKGIEHLVIAGNQTEYCINATTRQASELGYQVTLVEDGHGTWDSDTLSAKEIIDQHNSELGTFAALRKAEEVRFAE